MKIAVDFDGTIVRHAYPKIGKAIPFALDTLRLLQKKHQLILWTVREGPLLDEAVAYCRSNGVNFYAVNANHRDEANSLSKCRKVNADLFIDDRNIGGLPDWGQIYLMISEDLSIEDYFKKDSMQLKERMPKRPLWQRLFNGK